MHAPAEAVAAFADLPHPGTPIRVVLDDRLASVASRRDVTWYSPPVHLMRNGLDIDLPSDHPSDPLISGCSAFRQSVHGAMLECKT